MEFDWQFLSWLVPLIAGAVLTFGFGWLDSTLKYRREARIAEEGRTHALTEKKRQDAREHALAALETASKIRDRVSRDRRSTSEPWDWTYEVSGASWDREEMRELRDVGILIPDAIVREVIADAANFVTAASMVADGCGWELGPREIQVQAMIKLREVLGSFLRAEEIDVEIVGWFRRLAIGLKKEWKELERQMREEAEAMRSDDD